MKKVLIIANLFHSSPRIPGITKYLLEFGWESIILTVPIGKDFRNLLGFPAGFQEKVRIIEVPYHGDIFWFWRKIFKLFGFATNKSILNQAKERTRIASQKSFIDRIFNLYQTIFGYPDDERGWKKPAVRVGRKLLEKEKFDAIISSSSPVTAHIIANQLKSKYEQSSFGQRKKIPWIADFRDLWTQNHNYPYPWWRKIIERKLELKTLLLANVLITVAGSASEELGELHRGKETYTITNGFDPEKINNPPAELTSKFTITYTGQIYSGKHDPSKLFSALKDLISDKTINPDDIEVRFYGPKTGWIEKEIEEYGLISIVKQYGMVPREVSLKKQWESQILLKLNWEDSRFKGDYSGKIFEYLAAQRPILATGGFGNNVTEKLLNGTKAGIYAPTVEDIRKALKEFYLEHKQNGKVSYRGRWKEIKRYSYREMAKKFTDVLNKIT